MDAVDAKESAKSESTNTEKPTIHTEKVAESGELVLYQRFDIGDILWARMRGFPLWPAKVCLINLKLLNSENFTLKNFSRLYFR